MSKNRGVKNKTVVLIALIILVILLLATYFYIRFYVEPQRIITGRASYGVVRSICLNPKTIGYYLEGDVEASTSTCPQNAYCVNIPKKNKARCIYDGGDFEFGALSSQDILEYRDIVTGELQEKETRTNTVNINLEMVLPIPTAPEMKPFGGLDQIKTFKSVGYIKQDDGSIKTQTGMDEKKTYIDCGVINYYRPFTFYGGCEKDYYFTYKYTWMDKRKTDKILNQPIEVYVPYLNPEFFDLNHYYMIPSDKPGCKFTGKSIPENYLCKDLNPSFVVIEDAIPGYDSFMDGDIIVERRQGRCKIEEPDIPLATKTRYEYFSIDYIHGRCFINSREL